MITFSDVHFSSSDELEDRLFNTAIKAAIRSFYRQTVDKCRQRRTGRLRSGHALCHRVYSGDAWGKEKRKYHPVGLHAGKYLRIRAVARR